MTGLDYGEKDALVVSPTQVERQRSNKFLATISRLVHSVATWRAAFRSKTESAGDDLDVSDLRHRSLVAGKLPKVN